MLTRKYIQNRKNYKESIKFFVLERDKEGRMEKGLNRLRNPSEEKN